MSRPSRECDNYSVRRSKERSSVILQSSMRQPPVNLTEDVITNKASLAAAAIVAAAGLAWAPLAQANTISVGMQQAGVNGGAITTVASGASSASFTGSYGTFSTNIVSGAQDPSVTFPDLLFSNALDTSSSAAGR